MLCPSVADLGGDEQGALTASLRIAGSTHILSPCGQFRTGPQPPLCAYVQVCVCMRACVHACWWGGGACGRVGGACGRACVLICMCVCIIIKFAKCA